MENILTALLSKKNITLANEVYAFIKSEKDGLWFIGDGYDVISVHKKKSDAVKEKNDLIKKQKIDIKKGNIDKDTKLDYASYFVTMDDLNDMPHEKKLAKKAGLIKADLSVAAKPKKVEKEKPKGKKGGKKKPALKEEVTLSGKLATEVREWYKLDEEYEKLDKQLKALSKQLKGMKTNLLPALKALNAQKVRAGRIVAALEKKEHIPRPYKQFYEVALAKLNKRLREETLTEFQKAIDEGTYTTDELKRVKGALFSNIAEKIKTFFSKIGKKLMSIVSKNEKDLKDMEDALTEIKPLRYLEE